MKETRNVISKDILTVIIIKLDISFLGGTKMINDIVIEM